MSDFVSVLTPYIVSVIVAVLVGLLLRRKAPTARWISFGAFLATLSAVNPEYAMWFRVIGVSAGLGLVLWDFRRSRVRSRD